MTSRFFCPQPLLAGATVELPAEAAHHALKVLRVGAGETAILFDGKGGEWSATLQPSGKRLYAALDTYSDADHEAPIAVTLIQGLAAADKMDFVVQKAVELGVAAIQPVAAKRSVIRLSGERAERRVAHWNSIAVSACEQCGRNRVPSVAPILDLPQYLGKTSAQNALRLICVPQGGQRLRDWPAPTATSLMIGPEGGFTDDEVKMALAAGFAPVSLGPRVLRTETAGLAALAAIMSLWGDF